MLNTEQSRAGASAFLNFLKTVEQKPDTLQNFDHYPFLEWCVSEARLVFGVHDERQAGFIAALAEYLAESLDGTLNANIWKPEAMMTDDEVYAKRARETAQFLADEKELGMRLS